MDGHPRLRGLQPASGLRLHLLPRCAALRGREAPVSGFNSSVELLLELGPRAVEHHIAGLVDIAVEWASSRDDVRLVTPTDPTRRAGIVAMIPKGDVRAASARLTRAKVAHSLREGAIRLAPHCYNTEAEVRTALDVMVGEQGG